MQAKARRRRFSREPSASFNADSAYRTLQLRIASEPAAKAGNQEFICAKEAAAWLGVPLRSLHQYVQQGLLPSYKLGRHPLFRRQELLEALGASRIASRTEILSSGLIVLQPAHASMILALSGRAFACSAVWSGTYAPVDGPAKDVKALIPMKRAAVAALRYFAFAFISGFLVRVVVCSGQRHTPSPWITRCQRIRSGSTRLTGNTAHFSGASLDVRRSQCPDFGVARSSRSNTSSRNL